MSQFDSKALASAREVMALARQQHIGGDAQLIAKIQLLFVDAMEYAAPQSFGNSERLNSPVTPDGWIKCSEQLPAENDIVIVVDDGYFVCEAQYRDGDFYSAVRGAGEFFETTCRDVELWQQLPAAPKQESE